MAKAQYIGVSGVARKVKQPYVGVSGVARKVKSSYVGVSGVARQFFQGGVPASSLAVGSSVYLKENGTNVEYLVVHQGNPSTSLYDASCNGTWLLRKAIYEDREWHSENNNIYANSTIHSYLNSTFLNMFESTLQEAINQVKVPYFTTNAGTLASGNDGVSCKVFLLSAYEVGLSIDNYNYMFEDGSKLSYFTSGTSTSANNKRIGYLSGSASNWWTRSAVYTYKTAWCIQNTGKATRNLNSTTSYGVRPALILPSTALFNPDTLEFVSA